jgi:Spy/CpxP family protein refolding chaperone
MKKLLLALMAVAMGVLLTVPAFAFDHSKCKGNGSGADQGERRDKIFKKLNLTDEQKTKIEGLQTAHRKEVRPLREKMIDKSVELRKEWLQANPDKNKINAAQKEIRALRDSIEDKDTTFKLEIRQLLTPEQNEKMAKSHWGKGHGFGPRGRMGGHEGCESGSGMGMSK